MLGILISLDKLEALLHSRQKEFNRRDADSSGCWKVDDMPKSEQCRLVPASPPHGPSDLTSSNAH